MDQTIFDSVALWYPEMIRQAKKKLHFRYCEDSSAHIELVDTVIAPLLNRIRVDQQFAIKMSGLLNDGKLFNYIMKAIDSNAKFPSSPFLRSKLKLHRNRELNDTHQPIDDSEEVADQIELEERLVALLTKERFDEFFGRYSYLYLEIILQYSKPGATYKSIANYYGISKSSVAAAVINVKARLKKELESNQ